MLFDDIIRHPNILIFSIVAYSNKQNELYLEFDCNSNMKKYLNLHCMNSDSKVIIEQIFHASEREKFVKLIQHLSNNQECFCRTIFRLKAGKTDKYLPYYLHTIVQDEKGDRKRIICMGLPVNDEIKINEKLEIIDKTKSVNLTKREHVIVKLVSSGKTSKEIGVLLNISELTVKTHRRNIKRKLNVKPIFNIINFQ